MTDNIVHLPSHVPGHPLHLDNRKPDDDLHSPEAAQTRRRVTERDRNTCGFCGFKSSTVTRFARIDPRLPADQDANLIMACGYCQACLHVGCSTTDGSKLIWLPEISQTELNHAVRTCQVVREWSSGIERDARRQRSEVVRTAMSFQDEANALMKEFEARSRACQEIVGTSNPATLSDAVDQLGKKTDTLEKLSVSGMRLLPGTWEECAAWMKDGYANLNPRTWNSIFRTWYIRNEVDGS